MTALQDYQAARTKLEELQTELRRNREAVAHFSRATNLDELARTCLAEGAIFFDAGPLRQLQSAQLQAQILERAVELQNRRVADYKERAAATALEDLRRQRDQLKQRLLEALGEAAAFVRQIEQLQSEATNYGGWRGDFDVRQCLKSAGDTTADSADISMLIQVLVAISADDLDETPRRRAA